MVCGKVLMSRSAVGRLTWLYAPLNRQCTNMGVKRNV
jgi:hypothetical protein